VTKIGSGAQRYQRLRARRSVNANGTSAVQAGFASEAAFSFESSSIRSMGIGVTFTRLNCYILGHFVLCYSRPRKGHAAAGCFVPDRKAGVVSRIFMNST
jgi:hypothetical protein